MTSRDQDLEEARIQNVWDFHQRLSLGNATIADMRKIKNKLKRISSFVNWSLDDYISRLVADITLCDGLEINPSRQCFDEARQIRKYNEMHKNQITKMPVSGPKSRCFDLETGNIVAPSQATNKTKTLDGINRKTKTYFILKHIGQSGGSQDNQYRDLLEQINAAKKYLIKRRVWKFCIVVSGDFIFKKQEELETVCSKSLKLVFIS
jgi:hypothetical protein